MIGARCDAVCPINSGLQGRFFSPKAIMTNATPLLIEGYTIEEILALPNDTLRAKSAQR